MPAGNIRVGENPYAVFGAVFGVCLFVRMGSKIIDTITNIQLKLFVIIIFKTCLTLIFKIYNINNICLRIPYII